MSEKEKENNEIRKAKLTPPPEPFNERSRWIEVKTAPPQEPIRRTPLPQKKPEPEKKRN